MEEGIQKSIIILKRLNNHLLNATDGYRYLIERIYYIQNSSKDQQEISHIMTAMYCIIHSKMIWYTSFIEEYETGFRSDDGQIRQEIIDVRRKCQKYIDNVSEIFPDLKGLRNHVLAHPFRKKSIPLDDAILNKYFDMFTNKSSPEYYYQLSNTTNLIIENIKSSFGDVDESLQLREDDEYDLI